MTQYSVDESTGQPRKAVQVNLKYSPDFEVNLPLLAADLSLTLGSGTEVYDENISAQYTVP